MFRLGLLRQEGSGSDRGRDERRGRTYAPGSGRVKTEGEQIVARGFIKGVLWGTGVSLCAVTLVSALSDPPEAPGQASVGQDRATEVSGASQPANRLGSRQVPVAGIGERSDAPPEPDTLAGLASDALAPAAVPQTGTATDLEGTGLPEANAIGGISTPTTQAPEVAFAGTGSLETPATEPNLSISTEPAQPRAPQPVPQTSAFEEGDAPDPVEQAADPAPVTPPTPDATSEPEVATAPSISADPAQPAAPSAETQDTAFLTEQDPQPAPEAAEDLSDDGPSVMSAAPEQSVTAALLPESPAVEQVAPEPPAQQVTEAAPETPEVTSEAAAPETAPVEGLAAPQGADDVSVADDTAAEVAADEAVQTPQPAPEGDTEVAIDARIAPAPAPQRTQPLPVIEPESDAEAAAPEEEEQPSPAVSQQLPQGDGSVRVNRLPTLTDPPVSDTDLPETAAGDAPVDVPEELRPVDRYAAPFDNLEAKPVMAVVLMDDGADLNAAATGLAALRQLPYPVSLAVDALLPDAAERMAAYRAEGFEVLATIDLPAGATAADAEVNLSLALEALPQVMGVLEGAETGVQTTSDAGRQVASALAQTGHGFVTQNRGLNTVQKLAARDGVPSGIVFRDFDSNQQDATVIRRFMDQAAFRAAQDGQVIMLGRLREETLAALLLWTLQDRASTVAMAPISAALRTE